MEEKEVLGKKDGVGIQILMVWTRDLFAAFAAEIKNQVIPWIT